MVKYFVILMVMAMLARASDPGFQPVEAPGLQNVFSIGTNLFSGSSPDDNLAFETLQKLGIKTIITVDGAKPDLNRAHEFGMRYIHLPHGYEGISKKTQLQLAKAVRVSEGPIYVHCHHGQHRGPTAIAIICMADKGWSPDQAESWLHVAGTATNYTGLFATVRDFQPFSSDELNSGPSTFLESQQISGLVDSMVEIDHRFDNLQAIRKAGFKAPHDHPDLVPASEALLLMEHFRELQRTPESKSKGEKFLEGLKAAELEWKSIESLLHSTQPQRAELEKSFTSLANQCASCHQNFRDHSPRAQSK
jgi:protein tyrosine phosphatase (PTP) superfamily phosphohydrolase (DUF442 family)